jgi:hypothetical protein
VPNVWILYDVMVIRSQLACEHTGRSQRRPLLARFPHRDVFALDDTIVVTVDTGRAVFANIMARRLQ